MPYLFFSKGFAAFCTFLQIQSGQYRVGAVLGSGTELYIRRALPQLYRFMALMDSADEAFKQLQ